MNEYMQKPLCHGSEPAGSTEKLYEDEIYKYLAISSLLCFGTQ